ncbi:signal transduction histidine kinase [Aquimarina sp. EL_43]|uniref:tetratricopeptide repeat-containing sensor histidine kinase n=1 Tax=unclassified Aquimarina TaxID=2627091 RepID=UPI0018CA2737|nr:MULTISPECIES: tetratricopeptide repeat-containing sensor histidine kinase [unclassified Aquimarina]MBG6131218.1 signal transduction histidine kinase [Aquimarina sp. EL_35]MBG6151900.1 signal transduction histidine kinase [Aquimarina sp. EL_32]MBG6169830.1 signal transduction histidine kinase [Aquimarina sp. EL_43]
MHKTIIIWCVLLGYTFMHGQSQKTSQLNSFYNHLDSFCKEKVVTTDFCNAVEFYRNHKLDSCYIYAGKALEITKHQEQRDILHYIQGVSALDKNLYTKSLQNMGSISENFKFSGLKNHKLGRVYLGLEDYDQSIQYYKKWLNQDEETKDELLLKTAYHNLGISYLHKKEYANTKDYFSKELALIKEKDTFFVIVTKMELANAYYSQYRDEEAIALFKECYQLAASFHDIVLKQNTAKNMAVVEKNRKRYQESVTYYIEYGKWKDSIWNRDKIWELTEKDKQLAIAQKEQEIRLQDEKIKRQKTQRNGLIIGSSLLLLFIGVLGYFYKLLIGKKKLITEQKEQLDIANTTKDYLFSVVSHDLRSPVNALKRQHEKLLDHIAEKDLLGIKKTTNTAITLTESTSHLLNNVLHWSLEQSEQLFFEPQTYPLKPILEHVINDYEYLATTKNIVLNTSLDASILVTVDKESLKIVLRNILDNAIKYTKNEGKITITSGDHTANECFIEIKDTGAGIPPEILAKINSLHDITTDKIDRSKGVGLGLLLCHTLIKKNNGQILFDSEPSKGTSIKIVLPKGID